jgi:Protein of unknown function (DUF1697)
VASDVTAYVAFLRGINLGNRRVKMATLAAGFEAMGFGAVSTFIASGNVLFADFLGYPVDTFVRARSEVAAVSAFRPFDFMSAS